MSTAKMASDCLLPGDEAEARRYVLWEANERAGSYGRSDDQLNSSQSEPSALDL